MCASLNRSVNYPVAVNYRTVPDEGTAEINYGEEMYTQLMWRVLQLLTND